MFPNIPKIEKDLAYFESKISCKQNKWYTEYPNFSMKIPYTQFIKPLYTVYPKTMTDPC